METSGTRRLVCAGSDASSPSRADAVQSSRINRRGAARRSRNQRDAWERSTRLGARKQMGCRALEIEPGRASQLTGHPLFDCLYSFVFILGSHSPAEHSPAWLQEGRGMFGRGIGPRDPPTNQVIPLAVGTF